MVSPANLPRNRCDDRLLGPHRQSQAHARRRSRTVRYLRSLHGGSRIGIRPRPGRCNRNHRRRRRPHRHIPFIKARPQLDGCNRSIGLLLHGLGTAHPAANHATAHNQARAIDKDEARTRRVAEREDHLPHRRTSPHLLRSAFGYSAARYALLR